MSRNPDGAIPRPSLTLVVMGPRFTRGRRRNMKSVLDLRRQLAAFAASLIITRGIVGVAGVTELLRRVELRQRSSLVLAAVAAEVLSCRSSPLKCQIDLKAGGSDDPPFPFSSVRGERFPDHAGSLGAGGILRYWQL